jgi:chain length determinant protein EpsF
MVCGGVVLAALLISLVWPNQYTAISSVVIDSKADPLSTNAYSDQVLAGYVATMTDVIGSERVAQRAVKSINLDQLPRLQQLWRSRTGGQGDITVWLARYLLDGKVLIAVAGDTKLQQGNVINISVKWRDPKMAAAIANAFAQAAIDTNIELKVEPAKEYSKWFDQRSKALRAELTVRQKRLSDFETANGIIATDEKLDVETSRLNELSTQLVAIQGERQESQSRLHQTGGSNESLEEVLASPVIAKLKSDLSDAEQKQADVAQNLGKNHPDYQAAVAEVTNLRNRIRQESSRIASGIGTSTQVNVRRESEIRDALEQQKKRVLDLKHQHDQAAMFDSDVQTAQRDLDAVTQRFAQSSLESITQQTNMVLLTTATEPFVPSSPKLILNLLAGIFLGLMAGIGTVFALELKDPRVRDEGEVARLSGVPLLARVGSAKSQGARRQITSLTRSLSAPIN